VLGNGCTVEPGVELGPYAVIGDGWKIGRGARVSNSVLWEYYPKIGDDGLPMPADRCGGAALREVCPKVAIEDSIIVGGVIEADVRQSTVEPLDEGGVSKISIDYVPDSPRA